MSDDIRTKMEQAELKLLKQKAYLAAEVTFPKGNKFPEELREEVTTHIKAMAVRLAEGLEESAKIAPEFTPSQLEVLKLLADRAMNKAPAKSLPLKAQPQAPAHIMNEKVTMQPQETVEADLNNLGQYVGIEAVLSTLEGVPVGQRGKVQSGSKVRIEAVRPDGFLNVITPGGVRFNIDPTLLEFNATT